MHTPYTDLYFTLEIGGVKSYDAFFNANNKSRVKENRFDDLSLNEVLDLKPNRYHITYMEVFDANQNGNSEEDNELLSVLQELYSGLKEARDSYQ